MQLRHRSSIVYLSAILAAACADSLPAGSSSVAIGEEGGSLETAGGGAKLAIPAGALTAKTTITVETIDADDVLLPARSEAVTDLLRFGPAGLVFATPATLTIEVDLTALPVGVTLSQLVILAAPSGTTDFSFLATAVVGTSQVSASITRLSDFVVAFTPGRVPLCGVERESMSTWLRSTATGTEVFVIGVPLTGTTGVGCLARAFVEHTGATHAEYGELELDGAGEGTLRYGLEYDFRYEPAVNPLSRQGAIRVEHDPPITSATSFSLDGAQLLLTYLGETRRLTNIVDVIDALDPATMAGASDVLRLHMLPLVMSQVRVLGLGSGGMTQYVGMQAIFVGLVENAFTFEVGQLLMPAPTFAYSGFSELTGITTTGEQGMLLGVSGDGTVNGELDFEMVGRTTTVAGSVRYADLTVSSGLLAGGTYELAIDGGGTYTLPYTLSTDLDLGAVLPVAAP